MEGLGVAASAIAVIELSAKIASLCMQYSVAVKHAKADIERLRKEVDSVTNLLQDAETLIKTADNQLPTSTKLQPAFSDCLVQLSAVSDKLEPGKRQKIMSTIGVRALKWPFQSKEIQTVIGNLERFKDTISLALQVDQA